MKITIDTKQDSHEDIRKIVQLLGHLLGENVVTNAPEQQELPAESGTLLADIFGPATSKAAETQKLTIKEEDDSTKYEIVPY